MNAIQPPSSDISTWELFRELGFQVDPDVISDDAPGLSIRWSNCELTAGWLLNLHFQEVVLLSVSFGDGRTFGLIQQEMPRRAESREQGIAWLVWILDEAVGKDFQPPNAQEWLAEGRLHRHLLPWERSRAECAAEAAKYAARPRCAVRRDWMKLAIKTLSEHLATTDAGTLVELSFDGSVLTIRCADKLCVTAATGQAWDRVFCVPAENLRELPKRLMQDPVEVSVYDSCLKIDRHRYRSVTIAGDATDEPG